MKIVHLSDPHGAKAHSKFETPECDVLICSGDIGGRTNPLELTEFLIWFERQPARCKIFIAGNHDICLDPSRGGVLRQQGKVVEALIVEQQYRDSLEMIENYKVKYLVNKDYVFEGVKFYGSPYSPSFHREHWVFNADRGDEISRVWGKIPSDINVLITHTPPYGILDDLHECARPGEDPHCGCKDLLGVIKKRLLNLKLHCFGHIHDNTGCELVKVSNTRRVLFSNGAIVDNQYKMLVVKPLIINI